MIILTFTLRRYMFYVILALPVSLYTTIRSHSNENDMHNQECEVMRDYSGGTYGVLVSTLLFYGGHTERSSNNEAMHFPSKMPCK